MVARNGIEPPRQGFYLKDENSPADAVVLPGEVEVCELLGDEILAHMQSGDFKVTVSIDPHSKVDLTGTIDICLDMDRAHIFDSESGKSLTMPE